MRTYTHITKTLGCALLCILLLTSCKPSDFFTRQKSAKENYDLESQIEEAMECYKGRSLTTCEDVNYFFTGSSGARDGAYYYKSIRFMLFDWKTDADETYSFDVIYVLTEDEDPSQIGLSKILF